MDGSQEIEKIQLRDKMRDNRDAETIKRRKTRNKDKRRAKRAEKNDRLVWNDKEE